MGVGRQDMDVSLVQQSFCPVPRRSAERAGKRAGGDLNQTPAFTKR